MTDGFARERRRRARRATATLLAWLASWGAVRAAETPPLRVAGTAVEVRAGFVGEGIARVQILPLGEDGAPAEVPDGPFLVPQTWRPGMARLRQVPAAVLTIDAGAHRLTLEPGAEGDLTARLATRDGGGPATWLRLEAATGRLRFPIDGPIFGLGQAGQPMDRRGAVDPMRDPGNATNYPWLTRDWGERLAIPWVVSPKGWGILVPRPHLTFDLSGPEAVLAPGERSRGRGRGASAGDGATTAPTTTPLEPIDALLVVAPDPPGLMRAYAELSGYPALPPIWALGYQQSSRELASEAQILEIARTFRERQLPCDVLIYLSTGYARPNGWNTGLGSFEFNPVTFPRPAELLRELHAMNFRVAVHMNRAPRNLHGNAADPPQEPLDDLSRIGNYWARHAELMRLGIDAWWPDEGEELSREARMDRIRMYWEGPQLLFPDRRPYALFRTGAIGMQRYGGWLWSGDVLSTWLVYGRQIPAGLNAVVGGTPYWGTDTGGFYQGEARELTGELYARWFQFSAFCPLFRSHGQNWRYFHLPWGFSDIEGDLRDPRIEDVCRIYLDLRYRLMPYTYSLVREGHETGMPIMRPLWLHYPDDPRSLEQGTQYLWGRDLLVAPVIEKGATERTVYLPPGRWFDYWTGEPIEGGRDVRRPVDLATMPLYARAGAIVPLGPRENYTLEKPNDPLEIVVYPGADGRFVLIEDDGVSFSSVPMRLALTWDDRRRVLRVALEPGSPMRDPRPRSLEVRLVGTDARRTAAFAGSPLEVRF